MLVSQPEVDIEREKERLALAQPTSSAHDASEVASPPVVPTQRSRQDHSSKREKHTKFGEYILGNTIGEGEFGKVKLGWKSEGGVQVCAKSLCFHLNWADEPRPANTICTRRLQSSSLRRMHSAATPTGCKRSCERFLF